MSGLTNMLNSWRATKLTWLQLVYAHVVWPIVPTIVILIPYCRRYLVARPSTICCARYPNRRRCWVKWRPPPWMPCKWPSLYPMLSYPIWPQTDCVSVPQASQQTPRRLNQLASVLRPWHSNWHWPHRRALIAFVLNAICVLRRGRCRCIVFSLNVLIVMAFTCSLMHAHFNYSIVYDFLN